MKEIKDGKKTAAPFQLYHNEVVKKCFIDQEVLQGSNTHVLKTIFMDNEQKQKVVMQVPASMYGLQRNPACMKIFELTGLGDYFRMKPCQVDALRAHELLTTIQDNGTCRLTDKDGEEVECQVSEITVINALKLQEGNNSFSGMKVDGHDKKNLFGTEVANECIYEVLREPRIKMALQVHQQQFHMLKPQKYTHPDIHVAHIFNLAVKLNKTFRGDWGLKILKDIKRTAANESYQKTGYMGNGAILTRIAYEALGMRDELKDMASDEPIFQEIAARREETHKRVTRARGKTVEERIAASSHEETEAPPPSPPQPTIRVGSMEVPVGSTPAPVKRKRKEPAMVDEEAERQKMKKILDPRPPRARYVTKDEISTRDAMQKLNTLHNLGKKIIDSHLRQDDEPVAAELRTKKRNDQVEPVIEQVKEYPALQKPIIQEEPPYPKDCKRCR